MSADNMDTKPTIETVLERINALSKQVGDLNLAIQSLSSEVLKGFRRVDRQLEHVAGEMLRLNAAQRDLEDRMEKIEAKPS